MNKFILFRERFANFIKKFFLFFATRMWWQEKTTKKNYTCNSKKQGVKRFGQDTNPLDVQCPTASVLTQRIIGLCDMIFEPTGKPLIYFVKRAVTI